MTNQDAYLQTAEALALLAEALDAREAAGDIPSDDERLALETLTLALYSRLSDMPIESRQNIVSIVEYRKQQAENDSTS